MVSSNPNLETKMLKISKDKINLLQMYRKQFIKTNTTTIKNLISCNFHPILKK